MRIRDADKFHWRKASDAHAEFLREHLKNFRVIFNRKVFVDTALQKNLICAKSFGVFCFATDLLQGKHISAAFSRFAGKGTETTVYRADVRIIDDSVNRITDALAGELCVSNCIRRLDNFGPIRFL